MNKISTAEKSIIFTFGKNFVFLRKRDNMTQEALAYEMDIKRSRLSAWEEFRCFPRADMLVMVSDYFNVSIDDLLKSDLTTNKND